MSDQNENDFYFIPNSVFEDLDRIEAQVAPTLIRLRDKSDSRYIGKFDGNCLQSDDKGYYLANKTTGSTQWTQSYEGRWESGTYHGYGTYQWNDHGPNFDGIGGGKHSYFGSFFASEFEGYGNISYSNNTYFQENKRFGPGVFTDSAGYQDVGLWNGPSLRRLISTCISEKEVPRLAYSIKGKKALTTFTKLVLIENINRDIAKELLEAIGTSEELRNCSSRLYSSEIRNPRTLHFNHPHFIDKYKNRYKTFEKVEGKCCDRFQMFWPQPLYLDQLNNLGLNLLKINKEEEVNIEYPSEVDNEMLETDDNIHPVQEITFIEELAEFGELVKEELFWPHGKRKKPLYPKLIYSWNNDNLHVDFLQHAYRNQEHEWDSGFNVSMLLQNVRSKFRDPGIHETCCLMLLQACNKGQADFVARLLEITFTPSSNKYQVILDPRLADGRGNTCLMVAAANHHVNVIDILLDRCANANQPNDECVTPLVMCLLQYAALCRHVYNWERAFLILEEEIKEETKKLNSKSEITKKKGVKKDMSVINDEEYEEEIKLSSNEEDSSTEDEEESEIIHILKPKFWRSPKLCKLILNNEKSFLENITEDYSPEIQNYFLKNWKRIFQNGEENGENIEKYFPSKWQVYYRGDLFNIEEAFDSLPDFIKNIAHKNDELYQAKSKPTQEYLFNLSPISSSEMDEKNKKQTKQGERSGKKTEKEKRNSYREEEIDWILLNQLYKIELTICKLLNRGADPNLGPCPHLPLIIATVSHDPRIVELLLEAKANPNQIYTYLPGELRPLHILSLLRPDFTYIYVVKMLVKFGGNPTLMTDSRFDQDSIEYHLGTERELDVHNGGTTALHLIANRTDIQYLPDEMIETYLNILKEMLDSKLWRADPVLWLGLSPLGVAIQRGNERLVDALIGTFLCNPNEAQAKQLGFPLHLLANLQGSCQQNVDSQTITRMLDILLEFGADPLQKSLLGDFHGNLADYCFEQIKNNNDTKEMKGIKNQHQKIINRSAENFIRYLQGQMFISLFGHVLDCVTLDGELKESRQMNRHLEIMLKSIRFPGTDFLRCTELFAEEMKLNPVIGFLMWRLAGQEKDKLGEEDFLFLENEANKVEHKSKYALNITLHFSPWIIDPEFDDDIKKFLICFECGRSTLPLKPCSVCEIVYFCSKECKQTNYKKNNHHLCNKKEKKDKDGDHDKDGKHKNDMKSEDERTGIGSEDDHDVDDDGKGKKKKKKKTGEISDSDSDLMGRKKRKREKGKKGRKGSKFDTKLKRGAKGKGEKERGERKGKNMRGKHGRERGEGGLRRGKGGRERGEGGRGRGKGGKERGEDGRRRGKGGKEKEDGGWRGKGGKERGEDGRGRGKGGRERGEGGRGREKDGRRSGKDGRGREYGERGLDKDGREQGKEGREGTGDTLQSDRDKEEYLKGDEKFQLLEDKLKLQCGELCRRRGIVCPGGGPCGGKINAIPEKRKKCILKGMEVTNADSSLNLLPLNRTPFKTWKKFQMYYFQNGQLYYKSKQYEIREKKRKFIENYSLI